MGPPGDEPLVVPQDVVAADRDPVLGREPEHGVRFGVVLASSGVFGAGPLHLVFEGGVSEFGLEPVLVAGVVYDLVADGASERKSPVDLGYGDRCVRYRVSVGVNCYELH